MRLDADDEDDAFGNGKIPVGVVATPPTGTRVSDSYNDLSLSQSQVTNRTNSVNGERTDGTENYNAED